jgi:hypothetical protein
MLTAQAGVTMRLQIYRQNAALDAVDSAGGEPATLVLRPGDCTDDGTFSAVVTSVGPLVGPTRYVLTRVDR